MAGIRIKLLAGTALTLAGAAGAHCALADTTIGWYGALDAGQTPEATQTLDITDITLQSSQPTSTPTAPIGSKSSLKIDYGAAGLLRVGYRFTPNLRAEVELATRPGKIAQGLAGETTPSMGSVDKSSAMLNLIYDVAPKWGVHPFLGVGTGMVQAKTDYTGSVTSGGHTRSYTIHSAKTVPAGQVLAGASWYVTDRLRFDMTYRYLRTASTSYNVVATDQYTPTGGSAAVTDTYSAKAAGPLTAQTLTVGLRWTFGAQARSAPEPEALPEAPVRPATANKALLSWPTMPWSKKPAATSTTASGTGASAGMGAGMAVADSTASAADASPTGSSSMGAPMSAPAGSSVGSPSMESASASSSPSVPGGLPADAPAAGSQAAEPPAATAGETREYTVYFPFNSARLNATAQSVVASAAQYAQSAPSPKVAVTGYTDTSGSAAYNLILSKRRAHAVASGLKAEGVPASAITVRGMGEADLAVPTRNGVAKAKNRRTVIEVGF